MSHYRIFLGTYTKTSSEGIYSTRLDVASGQLSAPELAARAPNPTFLATDRCRRYLYAVNGSPLWAVPFAVVAAELTLRPLSPAPAESGHAPCHVAVDATGQCLALVNYHDGTVAAAKIAADGSLGSPQVFHHAGRSVHPERQGEPHPHFVVFSPDNRFALVCDLGLDQILAYPLDARQGRLAPDASITPTPPGSGPRHGAFSPDGRFLYILTEITSTVLAYAFNPQGPTLTLVDQYPALPSGFTGASKAAEICFHPGGDYLYVSNRGHDSLAIFSRDAQTGALQARGHVASGGSSPRSFAVAPGGNWIVAANETSNNVCSFSVTDSGATLRAVGPEIHVPLPVCVLFL